MEILARSQGQPGEHIEDRMAGEAVKFIRANKDRPFFLNYWAFSVHAPFDGKPDLIEQYRAKPPTRTIRNAVRITPRWSTAWTTPSGTLVKTLDEEGLWDNTIVVFTSDNGGNMYDEVGGVTPTSNDPLRSGKGGYYEGGTRVPCLIHWPGMTKPGTKTGRPGMSTDFFPTFCEMLGIAAPPVPFDGAESRRRFCAASRSTAGRCSAISRIPWERSAAIPPPGCAKAIGN